MKRFLFCLTLIIFTAGFLSAGGRQEADARCREVRFVEVQWLDIEATTASARLVLEGLGYETTSEVVSVPIAFEALKIGEADIFLGNWMPTMKSMVGPYLESGDIESPQVNLQGAKYTLAVPSYVAEGGITSFKDIADYADELNNRIYGIEAGNDGNLLIQQMIDEDAFGLGDFELYESSEAGMLAELNAKTRNDEWMVFLGWEPHPMNTNFEITYLSDGDDYFGPDYGAATVHTNVRRGYLDECPNVGQFVLNLEFTLDMENEIMTLIDEGSTGEEAAMEWFRENPDILSAWLNGVNTVDGGDGLAAVKDFLGVK